MASALAWIGLLAIVTGHSILAAVVTRLLRVRLATRWGPIVYTLLILPLVLFISTLILSGVFGIGPNLGGPVPALFATIAIPMTLGIVIDYLWMPAPADIDVPETTN